MINQEIIKEFKKFGKILNNILERLNDIEDNLGNDIEPVKTPSNLSIELPHYGYPYYIASLKESNSIVYFSPDCLEDVFSDIERYDGVLSELELWEVNEDSENPDEEIYTLLVEGEDY